MDALQRDILAWLCEWIVIFWAACALVLVPIPMAPMMYIPDPGPRIRSLKPEMVVRVNWVRAFTCQCIATSYGLDWTR